MRARVTGCNAAFARMLGYPCARELVGLSLTDELLIDSGYWESWVNLRAEIVPVDLALRRADGSEILVSGDLRVKRDGSGRLVGLEALLVAAMESPRYEGLEEMSRLQAIGALTSGIAHDFNNLLTVIVGNLYLLVEGVRDDDALSKKAKSARDAAKRGAGLIRQLLSFARRETGSSADVDVAATLGRAQMLLERALGPGIDLSTDVSTEVWPIRVDVSQLESALINLAINARDAMETGGSLLISAKNVTLHDQAGTGRTAPGDYVTVSVTDDGPGIARDVQERVFEPFFSTKTGRGGSGLGLTMVRRFAELSAGAVEIESEAGRGTTMKLFFPRAPQDTAEATSVSMTGTRPLCTLATGDEAVIVLSSDAHIRSTVQELLEVLGYSTTALSVAQDLYETLERARIDLLITDAVLEPGVSVGELLSGARQVSPDIKLILMDDRSAINVVGLERNDYDVMLKPFSLTELADTVRHVLDRDG